MYRMNNIRPAMISIVQITLIFDYLHYLLIEQKKIIWIGTRKKNLDVWEKACFNFLKFEWLEFINYCKIDPLLPIKLSP